MKMVILDLQLQFRLREDEGLVKGIMSWNKWRLLKIKCVYGWRNALVHMPSSSETSVTSVLSFSFVGHQIYKRCPQALMHIK